MLADRFPGVRFHFPNGLHARFLSREIASLLRKANARTIRLALEGLEPDIHCFDRSRVAVYVMVGLPGVGEEEVAEACRFVHSLDAQVQLSEYSPIPGTALGRQHGTCAEIGREPLLNNNKALFCWDVHDPFAAIRRLKTELRGLNAYL